MPVTTETLSLVADLRRKVDGHIDDATTQLAALYAAAWDQLYSVWYTPLTVLSGGSEGWPGRATVFRAVGGAAEATGRELRRLTARMTDLLARNVSNTATTAALSQTDIVRSQLPPGVELGIAAGIGVVVVSDIQPLPAAAMAGLVAAILARVAKDLASMPDQIVGDMRRVVARGPHRGLQPAQQPAAMARTLEATFRRAATRSVTAARTAVADAAREATRRQHDAHRALLVGWRWTSRKDNRTCLPAGTLITTRRGLVPIEDVVVGDMVRTHIGNWRRVYDTMSRSYSGDLVSVSAGGSRVQSTADHPFLVQRQGKLDWVEARHIGRGDVVLSERESVMNGGSHDVCEGSVERGCHQTDDCVSGHLEEQGLLGIPVGDLGMPVGFVNFDGHHRAGQHEVDWSSPSGDGRFLDELDTKGMKCHPNVPFRLRLSGESPVAPNGAELRPIGRNDAGPLAAGGALHLYWWPPTRFGTVLQAATMGREDCSAPCTCAVDGLAGGAGLGAMGVSVRVGLAHRELNPASRALLGDLTAPIPTASGTVRSGMETTSAELIAAMRTATVDGLYGGLPANRMRLFPLMLGVAGPGAELPTPSSPRRRYLEMGTAPLASPLHRAIVSSVATHSQATRVYNIEVEEDHSYIANGFAVHNCAVCWSMDGREFPLSKPGPFDHPNGRCIRTPVVKPWRLLGIDLPEPPGAPNSAEQAFFALPEADQVRIMGRNRLRMLRDGSLAWADLAQSIRRRNRATVKLRPLAA